MWRGDSQAYDDDRRYPPVRRSRASLIRSIDALGAGFWSSERRVRGSSDFSDFDDVRSGFHLRDSCALPEHSQDAEEGFRFFDRKGCQELRSTKNSGTRCPATTPAEKGETTTANRNRRRSRRTGQPARAELLGFNGEFHSRHWTAHSYSTPRAANHSRIHGNFYLEDEFHFGYFDGDSHIDDYMEWEHELEESFNYLRISQEEQVRFVVSKLTGRARTWWKLINKARRLEGRRDVKSWHKMKLLLREQFLSTDLTEASRDVSISTCNESNEEDDTLVKENMVDDCKDGSSFLQSSTHILKVSTNDALQLKDLENQLHCNINLGGDQEKSNEVRGEDLIVAPESNEVIDKAIEVHFREPNMELAAREKTCVNLGFVLNRDKNNNQVGCDTEWRKGTCSNLPFENEGEDIDYSSVEEIESKNGLTSKAENLSGEGMVSPLKTPSDESLLSPHIPSVPPNAMPEMVESYHEKRIVMARPSFGSDGQHIQLLTNHFTVNLKPQEQIRAVANAFQKNQYNDEPLISSCGITIEKQLAQIDGQILKAPTLKIGNEEDHCSKNGRWNFTNKKFLQAMPIESWAIVNFSARCDLIHLSREMITCARNKGITINRPFTIIEENHQYVRMEPAVRVEKMFEEVIKGLPCPPQLLLCVLPEKKELCNLWTMGESFVDCNSLSLMPAVSSLLQDTLWKTENTLASCTFNMFANILEYGGLPDFFKSSEYMYSLLQNLQEKVSYIVHKQLIRHGFNTYVVASLILIRGVVGEKRAWEKHNGKLNNKIQHQNISELESSSF